MHPEPHQRDVTTHAMRAPAPLGGGQSRFYRSEEELRNAIEGAICNLDLNRALTLISEFVTLALADEPSLGFLLSSSLLDSMCQRIGRMTTKMTRHAPAPCTGPIVIIATELPAMGGHTRVVRDLIDAHGDRECVIVLSEVPSAPAIRVRDRPLASSTSEVRVAPAASLLSKLRWMQDTLAELRPAKTYLLIHHFDAVAVAAVQPQLVAGGLIYFHNCDHSLALGVHLPHAVHVDYHAKGFHNCRRLHGMRNNVFWPLVAQDLGICPGRRFLAGGRLTTCTSGGFEKFESHHMRIRVPYLYAYADLLPRILAVTGGTHIHIGSLSEGMLRELREGFVRHGVETERFVHLPYVASLWRTLIEREVDLYIGSFPSGGGRAIVEVMGSGTPAIVHRNYRSPFFSDAGEIYPGAATWGTPSELLETLRGISVEDLQAHSQRARRHFEAHHRPELLQLAIRTTHESGVGLEAPPEPENRESRLQVYLDLKHAFESNQWRIDELLTALRGTKCDEELKEREAWELKLRAHSLQARLDAIESSTSWRVTAPLRQLKRLLHTARIVRPR